MTPTAGPSIDHSDPGRPRDGASTRRLTFLTHHPLGINGGGRVGLLLLVLDAMLLAAMWPVFRGFVLLAVICGLATSALLRRWNDEHPARQVERGRASARLPEINIGAVNVGGDFGGFLFLCAAVLSILAGVPSLRPFVIGSLACAGLAAAVLVRMRRSGIYTRTATHIWR